MITGLLLSENRFWLLIIILFYSPLLAQQMSTLSQEEFEQQLTTAIQNQNQQETEILIQQNRFKTKPFVDALLTQTIQAELDGDELTAGQKYQLVESIATDFQTIHQEKSLMIAVDYLSDWSVEHKNQKLIADSLYSAGTELRSIPEKREEALKIYQQALALYQDIGDQRGEGNTYGGIGFIYWYQNERELMLENFKKGLEVRIACDDKKLIGNAYNDIGSVYYYFYQDYPAAIEYCSKALEMRKSIGDMSYMGRTLNRMAAIYEKMGDLDKALNHYQQAADVHGSIGEKQRQGSNLQKAAIIEKKRGQYLKALTYLNQALGLQKERSDSSSMTNTLTEMGHIYRRMGEYELAYENYQKMLKLVTAGGDKLGIADALSNMGLLLSELQRHQQAIDNFEQALKIYKEENDQNGIIMSTSNIGMIYFDLKQYQNATAFYNAALSLSQEMGNRTVEVNNLINLGNTYNFLDKYDQALAYYDQGLEIAKEMNNSDQIWMLLLGKGDNYERQHLYAAAYDSYQQAQQILEGMRSSLETAEFKSSFLARKRYIYEAIVHMLCRMHAQEPDKGYDMQAFQEAEKGKARAFLDLMSESINHARAGEQLAEKNPAFADMQNPKPKTLTDIQAIIPDNQTVILAYFLGDSSSALWLIRKSDYKLFHLVQKKAFMDQIELIRYAMADPKAAQMGSFINSAHQLYQQLVMPAEHLIRDNDHLIILPDGILHYLPFEALLTESVESGQDIDYTSLPYLIKKNSINYAPSAGIWSSLIENRRLRLALFDKSLLAAGDPFFQKEKDNSVNNENKDLKQDGLSANLERLKYSGQEVERIAELFSREQSTVFLRETASETNIKKSINSTSYRFIHFATHGLINERQPDFSSIVFADDETSDEDGFLQTAEIFNLSLNTDLVVLSACETGLGKMVRGEGMIGLSRAFIYAGSPSVLVSLWKVADQSTATLMTNFYTHLVKEEIGKAGALRRAQLAIVKSENYAHPFYWAAFVLIGDHQ